MVEQVLVLTVGAARVVRSREAERVEGVDAVAGEGDGEGSGLSGRRFALRVLMVISPSVKGGLGFGLAFARRGRKRKVRCCLPPTLE